MPTPEFTRIKALFSNCRHALARYEVRASVLQGLTDSLALERDRLLATQRLLAGKGEPTREGLEPIESTYAIRRTTINPFTGTQVATYQCHICGPTVLPKLVAEAENLLAQCEAKSLKRRKSEADQREKASRIAAADGTTRKLAERVKDRLARTAECPYCEGPLGDDACADHIWPVRRGGLSNESNLVFVCNECNRAKRDLTLREFALLAHLDMSAIESRLSALGKRF